MRSRGGREHGNMSECRQTGGKKRTEQDRRRELISVLVLTFSTTWQCLPAQ